MNKEKVALLFEDVLEELEDIYLMYGDYITGEDDKNIRERIREYKDEFYKVLNQTAR